MIKKSGYITKKHLSDELSKLKKELHVDIGEQLDIKFAEYFEIMIGSVNKAITQRVTPLEETVDKINPKFLEEAKKMLIDRLEGVVNL